MRTESLISAGLLKSGLKRFWPLWVVYLVALLMFLLAPAYSISVNVADYSDTPDALHSGMQGVWAFMKASTLACAFAASIIVAVALNDHLFDSKAATFAGTLPLRRRTIFATTYLTGLVAQAAVLLVTFAALVGVYFLLPGFRALMVAQWIGLALALTFVFYSLASLLCQLTGTRPVAVLLYFVANILVVCIETAIRLVVSAFQYGMGGDWSPVLDWLSPLVGLARYCAYGEGALDFCVDWPPLVVYCIAAVAFVIVSGALYARRNLEAAGEAIAWPQLRPALKYLAGVSAALLFAAVAVLLFWSDGVSGMAVSLARTVELVVLMVLGGALGLLFSDMVMLRTTRVFKRCAKGGFVLTCIIVAFAALICFDAFGIARRIPALEEVQEVSVSADGMDAATLSSAEGIEEVRSLHADILAYGAMGAAKEATTDEPQVSVTSTGFGLVRSYEGAAISEIDLSYKLRNGMMVKRSYPVFFDGDAYLGSAHENDPGAQLLDEVIDIANKPEGRESRYAAFFDAEDDAYTVTIEYCADAEEDYTALELSKKEARDYIQTALKPDVLQHSGGEFWIWAREDDDEYDAYVLLYREGERPLYLWLGDEAAPNSVKWVREHHPSVKLDHPDLKE